MVKTRAELKVKIKEWVDERSEPFVTKDVKLFADSIAPNVRTSVYRLANYLKGLEIPFDKRSKRWVKNEPKRLKPPTL